MRSAWLVVAGGVVLLAMAAAFVLELQDAGLLAAGLIVTFLAGGAVLGLVLEALAEEKATGAPPRAEGSSSTAP